ncbi:MAG: branched-chain amino acid ABC transporter permease [Anaerolineales bacterium]|nr:branched-chain amino acid ABC transporter permease [Anaerolineales bacterium]
METPIQILQFLINALSLGGLYALMALGLALIYSILKLVNFAYGELVMIGGYTLLVVGQVAMIPWVIVAALAIFMAVITSLLLERVAFRPVRHASANTMLITSFAVSALLQNAALLFVSPRTKAVRVPSFFIENITVGGLLIAKSNILILVVSLALLGLLTLFLTRTILGTALRAAADDFVMAQLLGIRANKVIATAFAISGCLAGVVSLFWIGRSGSVIPQIGLTPLLVAFVALVIGGMGSLTGAVVGGYLLAFVTIGLNTLLPQSLLVFRQAFVFAIVILVLLFRPQGLISGASSAERI